MKDVEAQLQGTSSKVGPATTGTAAAAKGPWILDSDASGYVVGQQNVSKREIREADMSGPEILLSTANGIVSRRERTPQ
eukprot:9503529-Heterocapsa_arctica.AAC.1